MPIDDGAVHAVAVLCTVNRYERAAPFAVVPLPMLRELRGSDHSAQPNQSCGSGWPMNYVYDDGGRADTGFKCKARDCVARAIAIATGKPYEDVYNGLNDLRDSCRQTKYVRGSSAGKGVYKQVYSKYLKSLGWVWTPTMEIGSGCTVHLKASELPRGTLIVKVSRHVCAVIDGIIHDTYDPSRSGTRCVYGYWVKGDL